MLNYYCTPVSKKRKSVQKTDFHLSAIKRQKCLFPLREQLTTGRGGCKSKISNLQTPFFAIFSQTPFWTIQICTRLKLHFILLQQIYPTKTTGIKKDSPKIDHKILKCPFASKKPRFASFSIKKTQVVLKKPQFSPKKLQNPSRSR